MYHPGLEVTSHKGYTSTRKRLTSNCKVHCECGRKAYEESLWIVRLTTLEARILRADMVDVTKFKRFCRNRLNTFFKEMCGK